MIDYFHTASLLLQHPMAPNNMAAKSAMALDLQKLQDVAIG